MTKEIKEEIKELKKDTSKILHKALASWSMLPNTYSSPSWSPDDVDKMEVLDLKSYQKIVKQCRFFYKKDPIAGTVLNKLIEIGITDLIFDKGKLSENEFRIFEAVKDKIQDFMEDCAMEFLISGLVVPEIKYAAVPKEKLNELKIKKYSSLTLPISMWLRDPAFIKINSSMVMDSPSYYIILPEELIFFIKNKGKYPDGNKDEKLYTELLSYYPEFVALVMAGNREVLLENDLIVRRKVLTDSPYPIPYTYNILEALKHKRNLRRMDYSIASRVIGAIMLVKLGDKDFPIVEGDEDAFKDIKDQMYWRYSGTRDLERVFQLFANHTLQIEWVFPDVTTLLDDAKYANVNQDIFFGLGFPRILTTGETDKSNTSDPELSMESPIRTMENMQKKLLPIVNNIVYNIAKYNGLDNHPDVRFRKINLVTFVDFVAALAQLYNTGNLSRESYDEIFGYAFKEEIEKREAEEKMLEEKQIPQFAPQPFSPQPETGTTGTEPKTTKTKPKTKETTQ